MSYIKHDRKLVNTERLILHIAKKQYNKLLGQETIVKNKDRKREISAKAIHYSVSVINNIIIKNIMSKSLLRDLKDRVIGQ